MNKTEARINLKSPLLTIYHDHETRNFRAKNFGAERIESD